MSKTNHGTYKCNLCGADNNTNIKMVGYSVISNRRFKRRVDESDTHVCEECLKALSK